MTTTNETMDKILKSVGKAILIAPVWVGAVALAWAWYGYVLHVLWGWYMVPAFGAPSLSIPVAIGVSLIVGFMAKTWVPGDKDEEKWKPWARMYMKPALVLLIGWVVAKFL